MYTSQITFVRLVYEHWVDEQYCCCFFLQVCRIQTEIIQIVLNWKMSLYKFLSEMRVGGLRRIRK
jgi:hypothetical protein